MFFTVTEEGTFGIPVRGTRRTVIVYIHSYVIMYLFEPKDGVVDYFDFRTLTVSPAVIARAFAVLCLISYACR